MTGQGQTTDQHDEDDVAPPLTLSQHYDHFILWMRGISQHYDNLILWMRSINPWWVVLVIAVMPITIHLLGRLVYPFFPSIGVPALPAGPRDGGAMLKEIINVVVVGPVLETIAFQWFGTIVMRNVFRANRLVSVLLLSALFSFAHFVPPITRVGMFLLGILFTTFYFSRRGEGANAFYWVAGAHMLANFVIYDMYLINVI